MTTGPVTGAEDVPRDRALSDADTAELIDDVDALGGFFSLSTTLPDTPDLYSFARLYATPALVDARIETVRRRHEPAEARVAASIMFLGLAARLVSPALAAACRGALVELPATSLYRCGSQTGPERLHLAEARATVLDPSDPATAAAGLRRTVVEEHLRPLVAAVRGRVRVAERLLWGNAASAVGGAVWMLSRRWPRQADTAEAIADALIGSGPMAGLGTVEHPFPARPERFFARRSCCLFYRAPRGDMCGDCSLLDRAELAARWRAELAAS
ncbi:(2Fe-2S)-binding protein [Marinactinospora thermotolerans]|uniref:Uncharacterized Fe-S protein n=1 Tax=Marinactinospora thermotolerans DSM 45154 TaxID=1122192 RepID=A0A1T4RQ52_9ACTN|nr:(2Fe-2S)-binding protein [Marinactinospora thermotolerans]SKA18130.1 Uncharacterized Fe-S protein [Marinactinospora thermotolerans DSM 45154]